MSVYVKIDETGGLDVRTDFEGMAARSENLAPVWAQLHEALLRIEHLQFQYRGRGAHKWAPLARETRARKRKAGQREKIMIRTEELINSLTKRGNPDQIWEPFPGGDGFVFGSRLKQHAVHMDPSTHPYRPPIDLTPTDVRVMTQIIEGQIIDGGRARGWLR